MTQWGQCGQWGPGEGRRALELESAGAELEKWSGVDSDWPRGRGHSLQLAAEDDSPHPQHALGSHDRHRPPVKWPFTNHVTQLKRDGW